jgi:hypothetical protein
MPGSASSTPTQDLAQGNSTPTATAGTAAPQSQTGKLTGSRDSLQSSVNLTAEGTLDWAHWGTTTMTSKRGVQHVIGNWSIVGSGPATYYKDDPRAVIFADGDTPMSAAVHDGIFVDGQSNGFTFDAPADTNPRTLTVHVGAFNSGATFRAHLSDNSAPDFIDVQNIWQGQSDQNYTVTYYAGSAAQKLTVSWVRDGGTGNVTLAGAALR